MALVTNFLDRIKDLSGDCSDDNAIETFITDGCYDVINRVKAVNPQKLDLFTTSHSLTAPSVSVTSERDIVSVYRQKEAITNSSNLLSAVNSGFESSVTEQTTLTSVSSGEWLDSSSDIGTPGSISVHSSAAKTGSNGLLLTCTGATNYAYYAHTTEVGKKYKYTINLKGPGSNSVAAIVLQARTNLLTILAQSDTIIVTTGWQSLSVEFTATTTLSIFSIVFVGTTSDTAYVDDAELVSIENTGNYYPCRYVSSEEGKYTILNENSIYYANNAYDPVYYIDSGTLFVIPAPNASNPVSYKKIPEYTITNIDSSTSDIANFPTEYYEHVLTYAGIHNLQRQINNLSGTLTSGYTSPQVDGTTNSLTAMENIAAEETPLGIDANFDDYSRWFQVLAEYIEDEEDSELAQMQISKIQTYLSSYQTSQSDQQQTYKSNIERHAFLIQILQIQQKILTDKYTAMFISEGVKLGDS